MASDFGADQTLAFIAAFSKTFLASCQEKPELFLGLLELRHFQYHFEIFLFLNLLEAPAVSQGSINPQSAADLRFPGLR